MVETRNSSSRDFTFSFAILSFAGRIRRAEYALPIVILRLSSISPKSNPSLKPESPVTFSATFTLNGGGG